MASLIPKTTCRSSLLLFAIPCRNPDEAPRSLAESVQGVVQRIEAFRMRPAGSCSVSIAFQPAFMLSVLIYCYAQQIYGASEIARLVACDESIRELCHGEFPGENEWRLFRRENRSLMEECLTKAVRFLDEQSADNRLAIRSHESVIAHEVRHRIIMASCVDELEQGNPWTHFHSNHNPNHPANALKQNQAQHN